MINPPKNLKLGLKKDLEKLDDINLKRTVSYIFVNKFYSDKGY